MLSPKQQAELRRMHASGEYSISDLTEVTSINRPTAYRTLHRSQPTTTMTASPLANTSAISARSA